MPTTTPNKKAIKDRFAENLRLGIIGPESGGDYSAQNKEGSAAGKYQFTEFWLKRAKDGKSIQDFARRNPAFKVPETMEEFKADPVLQDAYFNFYAKEHLYPLAEKAYNGENPADLTIEQMGALFHFKPDRDDKYGNTGAFKQIRTGEFDEATKKGVDGASYTNMGSLEYIASFDKAMSSSKAAPISTKELVENNVDKKTNPDEVIKEYEVIESNIDSLDVPSHVKEAKRKELFQTIVDKGHHEIWNEHVEKENASNAKKFDAHKNLLEVFEGADVEKYNGTKKDLPFKDLKTQWVSKEKLDKIKEDFPELSKYMHFQTDGDGNWRANINQKSWQGSRDNNTIPNFVKDFNKVNKEYYGDAYQPADISLEKDKNKYKGDPAIQDIPKMFAMDIKSTLQFLQGKTPTTEGKLEGAAALGVKREDLLKERQKIDTNVIRPTPKEVLTNKKAEEAKVADSGDTSKSKEDADKSKEGSAEAKGLASQMMDNQLEAHRISNKEKYSAGKQKRELPIDAVAGMALGLIGNQQAKDADIPLRTEQVSQAVKNYTAELAEMSKKGLPVEVEAAMKNQLAEGYQGGLRSIVNASAGNRATVLGNQGQLETAKNKGLVDITLADYEAKQKAFDKYGSAIKYINDFDTNRDIANHNIKLQQGLVKQQEGKELANAGFSKMMDSIKYQRENGPGSANAMYKSYIMQEMFGFDPNMKDDGTGTVKGTKSEYEKRMALQKEKEGVALENREKLSALGTDAKAFVDKLAENGGDIKQIANMTNYLYDNPNTDIANLSLDNLSEAEKHQNYGLLSMSKEGLAESRNLKSVAEAPEKVAQHNNGLIESPAFITTPSLADREVGLANYAPTPAEEELQMPELPYMNPNYALAKK
jgi:hypothetical protein